MAFRRDAGATGRRANIAIALDYSTGLFVRMRLPPWEARA
jgi:hypothetical protein